MNAKRWWLGPLIPIFVLSASPASGQQAERNPQESSRARQRLEDLRDEARRAIEELEMRYGPRRAAPRPATGRNTSRRKSDPRQDLRWIGPPAVPEIAKAIERSWQAEKRNDKLCTMLLQTMWAIGSAESVQMIDTYTKQPDVEFRRLVAASLKDAPPAVATKAEALLGDTDEDGTVRQVALQYLGHRVPALRVVTLTGDPVPMVRIRAFEWLGSWHRLNHVPDQAASLRAAIPLLQKGLSDPDPGVSQAAFAFLQTGAVLAAKEGRDLLLHWITRSRFPRPVNIYWLRSGGVDLTHLEPVLAVARELGPCPEREANPNQQTLLAFVDGALRDWDRAAFPTVLSLVRQGYGSPRVSDWLATHAGPADRDAICANLGQLGLSAALARWLAGQETLPKSAWKALRNTLEEWTGSGWGNRPGEADVLRAMARTGADEAATVFLAYLERTGVPTRAHVARMVVPALCELASRREDEQTTNVLRDVLASAGPMDLATRAELFSALRARGAMTLAAALEHPVLPVRLAALHTLHAPLSAEDSAVLGERLPQAPRAVVLAALPLLAATGGEPVTAILARLLGHDDAEVRQSAVKSAGLLRGALGTEVLTPILRDRDASVRAAVCEVLGQLVDRASVEPLLETLRDPDATVRAAAREALEAIRFYHEQKRYWKR